MALTLNRTWLHSQGAESLSTGSADAFSTLTSIMSKGSTSDKSTSTQRIHSVNSRKSSALVVVEKLSTDFHVPPREDADPVVPIHLQQVATVGPSMKVAEAHVMGAGRPYTA